VGFLDQLKSQASALQGQQSDQQARLDANTRATETACDVAWHYVQELAKHLNVIAPAGPKLTLDGKTPWPAMKLTDFRMDSRKKMLRNREVFASIGLGWQIVPAMGPAVGGVVSVNFPPDLQRVEARLSVGNVKHERKEVRHPEKNSLQAIRFEYMTESRGSVMVTPDHDNGQIAFRVANATGFDVLNAVWPAEKVKTDLLDELAKLLVGQANHFIPLPGR